MIRPRLLSSLLLLGWLTAALVSANGPAKAGQGNEDGGPSRALVPASASPNRTSGGLVMASVLPSNAVQAERQRQMRLYQTLGVGAAMGAAAVVGAAVGGTTYAVAAASAVMLTFLLTP